MRPLTYAHQTQHQKWKACLDRMRLSHSSFAAEVDLQTFGYPQEGARVIKSQP